MRARRKLKPTAKDLQPHPLADLLPLLQGDEYEALVADIKKIGLLQPITLFDGMILDGRNRHRACEAARVKPRFETFQGTEEEALALVLSLNLQRRHLTTTQRAALAVNLLPYEQVRAHERKRAGAKDRQIFAGPEGKATEVVGRQVGLSGETVRQAAVIADHAPDVLAAMMDGTVRSMPEAGKLAHLQPARRAQTLAQMRDQGVRLRDLAHGSHYWVRPGVTYEWYTPPEIIEAARKVMGGTITLDPASSSDAQKIVKARRFFSAEDDGLSKPWRAQRAWVNPPFGGEPDGSSRLTKWVGKLLEEFEVGHIKQAMLLVRAATSAIWFAPLWRFPICFVIGKPPFIPGPGVPTEAPSINTAIVGFGVDVDAFIREFGSRGQVIVPDGGVSRAVTSTGSQPDPSGTAGAQNTSRGLSRRRSTRPT